MSWSSMIASRLHDREGKSLTNFQQTLPPRRIGHGRADSQRPLQLRLPHPDGAAHERELERGLLTHLRDLLLELGRGFAFVGSQVPLSWGRIPSISTCSSTTFACTATS